MPLPSSQTSTIGFPEPGSSASALLAWAETSGHEGIARLLLNALVAVETSTELGHIVDFLGKSRQRLAAWAGAGDELHGLAELAVDLAGQERVAVPACGLPAALSATSRLRGVASTHYLQLVLISAAPSPGLIDASSFETLRTWLLVEALDRARSGNYSDVFLKLVADGLRQAAKPAAPHPGGQVGADWIAAVTRLRPPATSLSQVRLYLICRGKDLLDDKQAFPPGSVRSKFLEALVDVACGRSSPAGTLDVAYLPLLKREPADTDADRYPTIPSVWDFGHSSDDELDDDSGGSSDKLDDEIEADVDPEATIARQAEQARYVHLVSAARARFIQWEWESINGLERAALWEKIQAAYRSGDLQWKAIGAFVEVALIAGRSLATALRIAVDRERRSDNNWHIHLDGDDCFLERTPPRRSHHAKIRSRIDPVIRPSASSVRRKVGSQCREVLLSLARRSATASGRCLGDIWVHPSVTPTEAFLQWVQDDPRLRRLTPGMLAPVAMQEIYAESGDWVLARTLSAPPDAGLPAAAGYSAYTAEELTSALAAWFADPSGTSATGSLIDAADAHYRKGFVQLALAIEGAAGHDLLRHHNLVTLYVNSALDAGTGVRPRDCLWTWASIDLRSSFAFVDDKTGIDNAAARWVGLPRRLRRLLQWYLRHHLPRIKTMLHDLYGETAGSAIKVLDLGLAHVEVCGDSVSAELLAAKHKKLHPEAAVTYPLPQNAFRHRARTAWRRHGCDHEVIDGFMGHSDGATRTYGDVSPRAWARDFRLALNCLDAAFDALQVGVPASWPTSIPAQLPLFNAPPTGTPITLPEDAPAPPSNLRWLRLLSAARLVLTKLSLRAVSDKPGLASQVSGGNPRLPVQTLLKILPEWDEKQVQRLVSSLTTTDKGLPARHGKACLQYLARLADRSWIEQRQPFRLRRRTFPGFLEDEPRATPLAIGARQRHRFWLSAFRKCTAKLKSESLSPLAAAGQLACSLVLESRITAVKLIEDAVRGHLRPVRFKEKWFVEWYPDDEPPTHGHGVVRFRVTPAAAHWLCTIKEADSINHSIRSQAPSSIRKLVEAVGCQVPCTLEQVVTEMIATVDARNSLELPGSVSAARAGRFLTASMSWPDWTRYPDGTFVTQAPSTSPAKSEDITAEPGRVALTASAVTGLESRRAAEDFCKAIRDLFSPHRVQGVYRPMGTSARRALKRALDSLCLTWQPSVSSAMLALGQWTAALFDRKFHGALLQLSSIVRYFSALAPRFELVSHDVDLLALDSDAITELYAQVLRVRGVEKPSYVHARLREFSRFCAATSTVAPPNWSELGVVDSGLGVSPGYVDESAYLRLLKRLQALDDPNLSRQSVLMAVLGYRFGLRAAEAALLRVRDVVGLGSGMYVIVERTADRDLKSTNGRRTVPLVFRLSAEELSALTTILAQARERARTEEDALLLADPARPQAPVPKDGIARRVALELRAATGNDHLTDHHLRHSFAGTIWQALEYPSQTLEPALALDAQRIRWILLGEDRVTRRAPWALAVILGHGHPLQGYRSYIHRLNEYGDELVFLASRRTDRQHSLNSAVIVNLDETSRRLPAEVGAGKKTPLQRPSAAKLMLAIRMISGNAEPALVARSLSLSEEGVAEAAAALKDIDSRLAESDPEKPIHPKVRHEGLLSHLNVSSEARLVALLDSAIAKWSSNPPPKLAGEEFAGMVSRRAQVSAWQPEQMQLIMGTARALKLSRRSLAVGLPRKVDPALLKASSDAGFYAASPAVTAHGDTSTDPFPITTLSGKRIESTYLRNPRRVYTDRLVFFYDGWTDEGLRTGYELVLVMLCLWLYWREVTESGVGSPAGGAGASH